MKKRSWYLNMLILFVSVIFLFLFIVVYSFIIQKYPKTTKYQLTSSKLPSAFNGYKILQISDLHNTLFGENQIRIMSKVKEINPDLIVFTGDLIDYRRFHNEIEIKDNKIVTKKEDIPLINLLEQLKDYPVYMVYGNHERIYNLNDENKLLLDLIDDTGAKFINDKSIKIYKENEYINLLGVADPSTVNMEYFKDNEKIIIKLDELMKDVKENEYTILLSHRPELLTNAYCKYSNIYSKRNIDLVLTGHAHGGQIRLPFVGGLYAPHQGKYPVYDRGIYEMYGVKMITSAGLGNSSFPLRVFNRPEMVLITLTD